MADLDRRSFLRRAGAVTAGTVAMTSGVEVFTRRLAAAASPTPHRRPPKRGYGDLEPTAPINGGEPWLALPRHFQYVVLSRIGDEMSDGTLTPRSCDGMGAFADGRHRVRLVRNHEIRFLTTGPTATQGQYVVGREAAGGLRNYPGTYDPAARGGNTTIVFDRRAFRRTGGNAADFVANVGSVVNCSGGVHPRLNAWFTCEEIVQEPGNPTGSPEAQTQRHGYVYPVPAGLSLARAPVTPQPVLAMGRFAHEAVAVDPVSGVIFETEDAGSRQGSGFYRFLPNNPANPYAGGTLQILGVAEPPNATRDLRDGFPAGTCFEARWINITQPNPTGDNVNAVFEEGYANGAALFNRLEGIVHAGRSIFFVSTSGGNVKNGDVNTGAPDESGREYPEGYGQIWEYHLDEGRLELLYESPGGSALDSPDNLVVSPRGGIVLCEDDASDADHAQPEEAPDFDVSPYHGGGRNRLVGLSVDGEAFPFAECMLPSELAGACWSPDGEFLFCNVFGDDVAGSGGTVAITGPWHRGAL